MKKDTIVVILVVCGLLGLSPLLRGASGAPAQPPAKLRVEISFPAAAHAEPITGRVFVMISRTTDREPRLQIGRTGVPFFGRDVEKLAPGQAAVIDETDSRHAGREPARTSRPATTSSRRSSTSTPSSSAPTATSSGCTTTSGKDSSWNASPGNLYSDVQKVRLDPAKGGRDQAGRRQGDPARRRAARHAVGEAVQVPEPVADEVLGPPDLPRRHGAAAARLRHARRSATRSTTSRATSRSAPPLGFDPGFKPTSENPYNIYADWINDDFPRMIVVTFQHPTPYFDDSYAVNSVNVGPYGDAIMQELIPEIEKRFRVIREPYARILSGGSTGGWESLALQIFHPDFFGGTWAYCPDSVTFTDVEGINIYKDENAFYKQFDWRRVPTINSREVNGQIRHDLGAAQPLRAA